jgi:molybdopterin-containing oxidoreductase family membrane subunit
LASAFVSGPAFLIVTLLILKRMLGERISDEPIHILINIVRVTMVVNLIMIVSEVFTEFYTGGSHTASARYLFFGLHGYYGLVPWIWTAMVANVVAATLFLSPLVLRRTGVLVVACVLAFAAIWIEKGMGLIIPGFIPSTLHEIVEYQPSLVEWKMTASVWALGLMIYTIGLKAAISVFTQGPELPAEEPAQ